MGASEQPPLPQQTQNQTKVRGYVHKQPHICMYTRWAVFRERSVWSNLKVISWCAFPSTACAHHRPLVALSHPADQLQSRPAAHEPHTDGDESAKQHDWQQRASATGPGYLLQGESSEH